MDRKNNLPTYRIPEGFNPYFAADTIRAITDAIHHLVTEGEMNNRPLPAHAFTSLQRLMELLQSEVHALHEYLSEIENSTTLDLPFTDAELEALSVEKHFVRETAAVYSIR